MKPIETTAVQIEFIGPAAMHNVPCAVFWRVTESRDALPAVYDCNEATFQPSWQAQREGWMLVRPRKPWLTWLVCKLTTNRRAK